MDVFVLGILWMLPGMCFSPLLLLFWPFTYLVLGKFCNIQSMETQHKCEVTILIKQNLHVLMQILYLSKLNKMFKNAFQNAFKKWKNTSSPCHFFMPRKPK
jgi:hypothetical protein